MSISQVVSAPGGHDAPLTQREDDLLDRWPVTKLLYRMITATPLGWSTRIGLYGPWGSGKSSVLNFLQQIAEEQGDIVVRFPAWRTASDEGFIVRFYLELTAALEREGLPEPLKPWLRRLSEKVMDRGSRAANVVAQVPLPESLEFAPIISAAATAAQITFDKLGSLLQLQDQDLKALREQLGQRRVLVFIDDLDRADPLILPSTLLALRELLDWPGFVFVLAFDQEMISQALQAYSAAFGESAQHFLDKIIDVPFHLPQPTPKQVQKLLSSHLAASCTFLPAAAIEHCARWFPGNPRQAKRLCRSLSVYGAAAERHAENELDWRGIILQTLLHEAEPGMAGYFLQNFSEICRAFGPQMFDTQNDDERQRHLQAALACSQAADSPRARSALQLFEELIKARIESRTWLDKVNYEMSLAVQVPAFTLPEFAQFFEAWREHRGSWGIEEFIREAVDRSGENQLLVIRGLFDAANIHYGQLRKESVSNYSRAVFEAALDICKDCFELIELLYGNAMPGQVAVVGREPEICLAAIRTFYDFSTQDDTELECTLRDRECSLAVRIARNCDDPNQVYFHTQNLANYVAWGRYDLQARTSYRHEITQALVPQLINQAIELFATPNGIANAFLQGESKYLWVLNTATSPLYQAQDGQQRLAELIQGAEDARSQSILAENALSYLGYFTKVDDDYISSIISFEAPVHSRYVELAWQAVIRIEPRIQTLVYLKDLRVRLLGAGIAEGLLPTPVWWDGRNGDIEHELQGF